MQSIAIKEYYEEVKDSAVLAPLKLCLQDKR